MTFFSDAEVASMQDLVETLGFKSDVMILARTIAQTANGLEDQWPNSGPVVKGWLFSEPSPTITLVAGEQVLVNTYRLFLPVETAVNSGDQVLIGGNKFSVSDTIAESTWLALLRCTLRRVE